ncbi:MAG TPA: urate hydroxylase PuuD, partial [bacterium]|nr:urate hydroxylase PuuD [bacterium]
YSLGVHAKTRSTHNTYFTFPVIFLMISQHFPLVFTAQPAWLVLILFFVLGAGARHIMLVGVRPARTIAAATAAALVILVYLTARPALSQRSTPPAVYGPVPSLSQVRAVLVERCAVCHSETPVMPGFVAPPLNVKMDTLQQIRALAGRIRIRAVEQRTMPPGNITHITDEERALLRRWIDAGAPLK